MRARLGMAVKGLRTRISSEALVLQCLAMRLEQRMRAEWQGRS